ncbi:hypothetical protein JP88_004663 [Salmonella enterica subsp. enterica]|nr:hypothetical protein [Salmonella enterica]EBY0806020.1 hypothetical protein [Salmonella enterica subsp. enterica serovar Berlin]ECF3780109.1 hypothetical protein [Salmonella enterica subsp. enterica serovar Oslo]EDR2105709.1 hypothetical protein [Salmonella enterica subsp. enterica]EDW0613205.1 hypothetical protein [Salmonella enterica subsp. enterica serovar Ball]EGZ4377645.1 hypothetical protein [Salmonella enterica subsp. enterica serovar Lexington]
MSFVAKKERAIAIMESKKMWSSNYAPPLLRLAWKAGLKIPPLPFAPFWQVALFMGIPIGSVWGILMWFFTWKESGMLPVDALAKGFFFDVWIGISMALYHWWRRVANNLPDWDSLE